MHFQQKKEQYEILLLVAQKNTFVEICIPFFVVSIAWFYSTNCVLQIPETANTNLHMSISQSVVRLVLNMRKY